MFISFLLTKISKYYHATPPHSLNPHHFHVVVCMLAAAGRYCKWKSTLAVDSPNDYDTFDDYRDTLTLECDPGEAARLTFTPDSNWPDEVYYQVRVSLKCIRIDLWML